MTTQQDELPLLAAQASPVRGRAATSVAGGIVLCLFLAIAQIAIAGYQLGVGNQAIQIAFLKRLADPTLFANDDMVRSTLPMYPSYFFFLLSPLAKVFLVEPLYLTLHVLTTFLTLVGVYLLGRGIFRAHGSALVAVLLLVAGQHQALAGDALYSTGFTHTYAALPLALAALALVFSDIRGKFLWAFGVAGVLFNFHALTGAYTMAMLGFALLADARTMPVGAQIRRAGLCVLFAVVLAAPTLALMLGQHQQFSPEWINLMRIRSAEHSFPSTWWSAGNPDLPRFGIIFALFALSWSFPPRGEGKANSVLRISLLMTAAVTVIFILGYVFTEIVPLPVMIRFQPFRASRLLMLLMFVHIAHAAVRSFAVGFRGTLPMAARALEIVSAVFVVATLGVPSLISLLPLALVLAILAAIVSGRLSWVQAFVSAMVLLVVLLAYLKIDFPLPFLSPAVGLGSNAFLSDPFVVGLLLTTAAFGVLLARFKRSAVYASLVGTAFLAAAVFTGVLFSHEINAPPSDSALASVSHWAETHTPKDAVFLTPSGLANFRILSDRGLVADWRDGTQLYFSGQFAADWFKRLSAIEPGIILSPGNILRDPVRLIARGRPLDSLETETLLSVAKTYGAKYILLPTPAADHVRSLPVQYADSHYTVYLAADMPDPTAVTPAPPAPSPSGVTPPPAPVVIPKGVIDPKQWRLMQDFMHTTVAQNIDTYRKAALSIQIVDGDNKPVTNLPIILNQTRHAFDFGVSLGFFLPNDIDSMEDQKPNVVTPRELQITPTIFNASMIPFSSKWMFIEPEQGKLDFRDLDKYVDYCTRNHMTIEYHFLAGSPPHWMYNDYQQQLDRYPDHCRALLARYADRIKYWQLTNEERDMPKVPQMFKEIKQKYPNVKLGIADCVKFGSDDPDEASAHNDMYKGVQYIPWLKTQGVQLDYFGIHGHRPFGLWADPRIMYEVMDTIAKQKVKIHITEMLLPLGDMVIGPVMRGRWTAENEADFLEQYLTVCFSHPSCELINFWGLTATSWGDSTGLLDAKENPRPALLRMAHLINEVWHTHVEEPLPDDGTIATRAFHGTYQLSITLADGRTVTTNLDVPVQPSVAYHLKLDRDKGTLTVIDGPGPATDFPVAAETPPPGKKMSMSGKPITE